MEKKIHVDNIHDKINEIFMMIRFRWRSKQIINISIKNILFYNIPFKIKLFFKESKLFLLYEDVF